MVASVYFLRCFPTEILIPLGNPLDLVNKKRYYILCNDIILNMLNTFKVIETTSP